MIFKKVLSTLILSFKNLKQFLNFSNVWYLLNDVKKFKKEISMKLHGYMFTFVLLFVCQTHSMHKLMRSIRCMPHNCLHGFTLTQRLPIAATKRFIATNISSTKPNLFGDATKENLPDYEVNVISAINSGNILKLTKAYATKPTTFLERFDGITPLHFAATCRRPDIGTIIEIILAAGTPIDEQTNTGDTALHLATQNDNKPAIVALMKNGADPIIKNKAGKGALDDTSVQVNDLLDE